MPNTLVQAAAEGLPKITRRLFLRSTAVVAGVGTIATVAEAEATAPARTAKEEAIWLLRKLERLLKEDGATRYVVMVVGNDYPDGSGPKCIQICDDAFRDDDRGMFVTKGGEA